MRHITSIKTGAFIKTIPEGEIVYFQAKHFSDEGRLLDNLHPDVMAKDVSEKHLLHKGDVLFIAKGTKNIAAVYENNNLPAVASTSFFVLRLLREGILPEYLAWFINQPDTQRFLKGSALGSSMVSISKAALEQLEISIPDMETQKAILRIMQLRNLEKMLKQQIEILKEKLIQKQINKALK